MQQPGFQNRAPASSNPNESEGRTGSFHGRLPVPNGAFWSYKKVTPNAAARAPKPCDRQFQTP